MIAGQPAPGILGRATMTNLAGAFSRHLSSTGLLSGASRVVVAVSGGADSTALLVLLHDVVSRSGVTLVPSHVGHQLRGVEGDRDARLAADLASSLGLPFVYRSFAVRELRDPGESLEATARRVRYESLLALARDLGPGTPVATGHTLDDQAETVLLHLERRLGRTRGGIQARRADGVVRPLLPFRRDDLRAHLAALGVAWREDASNRDERIARNRIRHRVLPALEERWPGATERLARAAAAWTGRLERLDLRLDEALRAAGAPDGGPWPRGLFAALGPEDGARLLVRAVGRAGRVPGRQQLVRSVARILSTDVRFREALGGGRLAVEQRTVSFLPAGRLEP